MNLLSWHQIVKDGILPEFRVCRPLVWTDANTLQVGDKYPGNSDPFLTRILYDQNRIELSPPEDQPKRKKKKDR